MIRPNLDLSFLSYLLPKYIFPGQLYKIFYTLFSMKIKLTYVISSSHFIKISAIFLNFVKIVIESYAYRLYALKLEWKQPEPIQYSDKLALASFSLAGNLFKETCQRNYLTGNFRKALFFYYLKVFDENMTFFKITWSKLPGRIFLAQKKHWLLHAPLLHPFSFVRHDWSFEIIFFKKNLRCTFSKVSLNT